MGPMALPEPSLAAGGVPVPSKPSSNPRARSSLLSPSSPWFYQGSRYLGQHLPTACKGSKSVCLGEEMKSGLPGRHHLASQPQPCLKPDLSIC